MQCNESHSPDMRLTDREIAHIRRVAARIYGDDVRVTMFGSRVDDQAKGGDIDLLIESTDTAKMTFEKSGTLMHTYRDIKIYPK